MVGRFTYFAGLRVTVNDALMTTNSDPITQQVLPQYRSNLFTSHSDPPQVVSQPPGYSPTGGYLGLGGYSVFLRGNQSQ